MFWDKVLKLFSPNLLPLLFIKDIIVMLDHLFDGFPELLDHTTHVDCFFPYLNFLILKLLFFLKFLLLELLFAHAALLLGISNLFLVFPLKIFSHPFHLLNEKVPMTLWACWLQFRIQYRSISILDFLSNGFSELR